MRHVLLFTWMTLALVAGPLSGPPAAAQISPGERISLRETLEKGLRARNDRDRQFVGRVIDLVDRQIFSRELVLILMQQARQRHARVPMVYFVRLVNVMAKEKNLEVPY